MSEGRRACTQVGRPQPCLSTAETFALPLLELGVRTYSSALFNVVPGWAIEFYEAVRAQDRPEVYRRLNEFVIPYLA